MTDGQRTGYVAIVGRPNVGKSTLLNHMLGRKISITSRKPHTTRQRVLGIKTDADTQTVFVDTPGLHTHEPRAINRSMNRAASGAIRDVDIVVMVVDRTAWTDEDERVLRQVRAAGAPVVLAINKIDLLSHKGRLLPYMERLAGRYDFRDIVPVSALNRHNVEELERLIVRQLPRGGHFFPADQITDRGQRFLAAEIVREKITRQLGDELPYAIAVAIDECRRDGGTVHIAATVFVERNGQKRILIGAGGSRLRSIGAAARRDMEPLFDAKIMLRLWVKVKSGWSDDERALHGLGYRD